MFEIMQLTDEIKYTMEILILLGFACGFLCGYLWSEHKYANKIHNENEKAFKEE